MYFAVNNYRHANICNVTKHPANLQIFRRLFHFKTPKTIGKRMAIEKVSAVNPLKM